MIGFTKGAYDVIENEDVEVKIGFASGTTSIPVTVTYVSTKITYLYIYRLNTCIRIEGVGPGGWGYAPLIFGFGGTNI